MNKKWEFYNSDENKIKEISQKFNISELLATVLVNRNIIKDEDVKLFLDPTRNDFHDPYLMPDMEIAVNRIVKAIEEQEKTMIYGDYDVDGITSITVLSKFLKECGLDVGSYIPNRLDEGYGLNREAIKSIADQGYKLIITVDCGISGTAEIDYAYSLGMEVIVTDHHEPLEILPKALAVIDCKRKDNKYPFNSLAGVGVAFKLVQAIGIKLGIPENKYLKYLDIVCIGTISDIVPLVDENRVIVKLGLKLVEQTKNLGLKAILQSSGYGKIDSSTISFGVAPRINACGRMGHQEEALKLFLSKEPEKVSELTQKLNEYNRIRQETEKSIYNSAVEQIDKNKLYNRNTIVLMEKNWHHGVIGIVASKITEMYFKPSILLCEEEKIGKGSGRSIPGFDLYEALTECKESIEKFGGHSMAVGINIKKDNLEEFKEKLEKIAQEMHIDEIVPILKIDAQINLDDVTKEMVESLKELEPFGE